MIPLQLSSPSTAAVYLSSSSLACSLINPRLKIERDNVIAASSSPSASSSQNRNSSHNALISSAGTSKASSVVSSDSSSASPSMSSSLGVAESGLVSGGGAGGGSQSTSSSQRQVKFSEANMAEHHVTIMDQPQITVSDEDHAFRTRIERYGSKQIVLFGVISLLT